MARSRNADPEKRIRFERNGIENIISFGDLGRLLKTTRKSHKDTLQEVANKLNAMNGSETTSQATLSRIENGEHMPSYGLMGKILIYVYDAGVMITQDALNVDYRPASSFHLLKNLLSQMPELDPSDEDFLLRMFETLVDRRSLKRAQQKEKS
jgi:transcriptional regulator with XRE-family HTH domain